MRQLKEEREKLFIEKYYMLYVKSFAKIFSFNWVKIN